MTQIFLPSGKKWFRNDLCLAEERKPLIHAYLNGVVKLKRISESQQAQAFFKRRPGDPEREDPLLQSDDTSTLTESDKEAVSSASEAQGSAHSGNLLESVSNWLTCSIRGRFRRISYGMIKMYRIFCD